MRRYSNHKIWFTAFLLLIFATGCSDPDKTGTNPGLTPPTVISVTPASGATGVCPNTVVTATFSEAMNPSTINATTFTVAGPGRDGNNHSRYHQHSCYLHTVEQSRTEYRLHRHDYDRSHRRVQRCAGE